MAYWLMTMLYLSSIVRDPGCDYQWVLLNVLALDHACKLGLSATALIGIWKMLDLTWIHTIHGPRKQKQCSIWFTLSWKATWVTCLA